MASNSTDEMEDRHRDVLHNCLSKLVDTITLDDAFYDQLISSKVLTKVMAKDIKVG